MDDKYTTKDLEKEISDRADHYRSKNSIIHKAWLIQDVVNAHSEVHGADEIMARFCINEVVTKGVEIYFNRLAKSELKVLKQPFLPGLPLVRPEYLVRRSDVIVGVPTDQMSEQEIKEKISELLKMAAGLEDHAEQLKRYLEQRQNQGIG